MKSVQVLPFETRLLRAVEVSLLEKVKEDNSVKGTHSVSVRSSQYPSVALLSKVLNVMRY